MAEVDEPPWRHTPLLAAAALLALLGLGSRLWWQRQAPRQARRESEAQRQRLNALGLLGLQVDAQASGDAALQRVQTELAAGRPCDVMLVDWRMPPPDGVATLRQLRALLGPACRPASW